MVFERALETPLPLAVSEGERLVACNAAARKQGIRPGLADAAARALSAELRILPRPGVYAVRIQVPGDVARAGSKDKLKEVGKALTATTFDALHRFWQRLMQTRPEARELARRSATEQAAAEESSFGSAFVRCRATASPCGPSSMPAPPGLLKPLTKSGCDLSATIRPTSSFF